MKRLLARCETCLYWSNEKLHIVYFVRYCENYLTMVTFPCTNKLGGESAKLVQNDEDFKWECLKEFTYKKIILTNGILKRCEKWM